MKVVLNINDVSYETKLQNPIDISMVLKDEYPAVNCFFAPLYKTEPIRSGDFVGDTSLGGLVNFKNIFVNPHGNGTHTECVGHIATETYRLNDCLTQFHFSSQLITVIPTKMENGDRVVLKDQIVGCVEKGVEAIVLRTMPNDEGKLTRNYSGANPPYIAPSFIEYLVGNGIKHLLVDLPSVDGEEDGGRLESHRAFWQYPTNIRKESTITELIFVPNEVKDGLYLVNILIGSYDIDVSPSKILLFPLERKR